VSCLACGQSFKQLSLKHLREHGLDGGSYREKYGIPPRQPLSARAVTTIRQQIVQTTRPWEKAPTYLKAQEKKQEKVTGAQRKKTARAKA